MVFAATLDYHHKTGIQADMQLLRHLALNSIISDKIKKEKYIGRVGVVLAFDGSKYWRKEIFPNYKQNRKKGQQKSTFNFQQFYKDFNQLKQEFRENLPYYCVQVDRAEADDIIAVLSKKYAAHEPVCIVSADKDFLQIQEWGMSNPVVQYSPYHKKFLTLENRDLTLIEHIAGGDASDGIPNIWSNIDTFMDESLRQKPFSKKLRQQLLEGGFSGIAGVLRDAQDLERFKMNQTLIDLQYIPEDVTNAIIAEFDSCTPAQGRFHQYCIEHRLRKIMEMGKI